MVKRSDGRWQERIIIDGNAKYIYGKSKAELTRKINEFYANAKKRYFFSEVAADWKEEHFQTVASYTAHGYEAAYKSAIAYFSDRQIDLITPQDILIYLHSIRSKGYATKTIMTYKLVLSLIFKYAIVNGFIKSSPVEYVKVPKGKDSVPREIPTDEEIQKVLNDGWLLPVFILYTGCRRGEVLAITYEDIDFKNKTIRINKAVAYVNNKAIIKATKTKNSNRTVPLLDELAERLPRGKGLIFGYDGKIYTQDRFRGTWEKWRKNIDVEITPHQLRHAFATICHDAGLDAKDAMALLGHADIQTTMNIYTHIDKTRQTDITNKLNSFTKKYTE